MRRALTVAAAALLPAAASAAPNATRRPRPPLRPPRAVCVRPTTQPPALGEEWHTARGPPRGSIVVAGGSLSTHSPVFARFAELATVGGAQHIVYVPTASGLPYSTALLRAAALASFEATSGLHVAELVHTYDPAEADTAEFAAAIDRATGVFFGGGRQWRISDAYMGTAAQRAFERVLERGGVIGGSSAGAAFQGDVMIRGCANPNNLNILLCGPDVDPPDGHLHGFGYATGIGFDPHHIPRGRMHDDVELVLAYPRHIGIGLDEDTAVVFSHGTQDVFQVVSGKSDRSAGAGYVVVVDPTLWEADGVMYCGNGLTRRTGRPRLAMGGRELVLMDGDRYNVRTREVVGLAAEADDGD